MIKRIVGTKSYYNFVSVLTFNFLWKYLCTSWYPHAFIVENNSIHTISHSTSNVVFELSVREINIYVCKAHSMLILYIHYCWNLLNVKKLVICDQVLSQWKRILSRFTNDNCFSITAACRWLSCWHVLSGPILI